MLTVLEKIVADEKIISIYERGFTKLELEEDLDTNGYLILRSRIDPKRSAMGRYIRDGVVARLYPPKSNIKTSIQPRDSRQNAFADALNNPDIILNVAVGTAGTGKTTLAIAHAARRFLESKKPIYLTKPTEMVGRGKAFGPVPGDVQEKYAPYLASYEIVLKKVLGDQSKDFIERMKHREHLQYIPIELVRGCTFENCTFIIDEAQNLSWHELNTVVSRMGENTELIVLGDLHQIDRNMTRSVTGLYKLVNSEAFRRSEITSGIMLKTQYRSPITQLVADIDEELRENER